MQDVHGSSDPAQPLFQHPFDTFRHSSCSLPLYCFLFNPAPPPPALPPCCPPLPLALPFLPPLSLTPSTSPPVPLFFSYRPYSSRSFIEVSRTRKGSTNFPLWSKNRHALPSSRLLLTRGHLLRIRRLRTTLESSSFTISSASHSSSSTCPLFPLSPPSSPPPSSRSG